jgi:D-tyrosyl-tRNA(Tyr) deacylase
MRAVVTRVKGASVTIKGETVGEIGKGFLVLLGISVNDTSSDADKIADRICGLRVFEDENGKMNLSPDKAGAEMLIVSQFTLYADCSSRRPGFTKAAGSAIAEPLYERCVAQVREKGFKVECGVFGADMLVASLNDGPVTLLLDTDEL